jgi:hypothetical protein
MLNDGLQITGAIEIKLNGDIVRTIPNLVVTSGKTWVAKRLDGQDAKMGYIDLGTGSTSEVASDTALETVISGARKTNVAVVSSNTVTYTTTWNAGEATAAITEAGLFDATTGGEMLARKTFGVVNKGTNDTMTISWTITIN